MKRTNETGRSMVEMLGVLAIIGVLSIGGIAGYTLAMNRYRSNQALDMANKYAALVFSNYQTCITMGNTADTCKGQILTFANMGLGTLPTGLTTLAFKDDGSDLNAGTIVMTLTFDAAAKGVCKATSATLGMAPDDNCQTVDYTFKQS